MPQNYPILPYFQQNKPKRLGKKWSEYFDQTDFAASDTNANCSLKIQIIHFGAYNTEKFLSQIWVHIKYT